MVDKGEIAHFEQFHLFPQCFPKAIFFSVVKRVYMEGTVNRCPYFGRSVRNQIHYAYRRKQGHLACTMLSIRSECHTHSIFRFKVVIP